MSVIRFAFLILFIISCNSQETKVASPVKGEAPYFPPSEVIAGLNGLVAIIDWPKDTLQHQKNLGVTPDEASKILLPLHPIWDEKINEVAAQIASWDQQKISTVISECAKKCECDFYQEVLDRNPDLLTAGNPELKNLSGLKIEKTKEAVLRCMETMPSLQKLLDYLRKEQKAYEAESSV